MPPGNSNIQEWINTPPGNGNIQESPKKLRKRAAELERQQKARKKAEKHKKREAREARERRRLALDALTRIATGDGLAAVEAARELLK